jgi:type IV pilus assembly protein PilV
MKARQSGPCTTSDKRGSALIETLIAIVIFSLALLGLIGVQATMIGQSIDAKYRADAAYLANQIIAQMWVDRTNLAAYAHNPSGTTTCAPSGASTSNANALAWLAEVAQALPGAASTKHQIVVTAVSGTTTYTTVQVTICWQRPQETSPHNFATTAQIGA